VPHTILQKANDERIEEKPREKESDKIHPSVYEKGETRWMNKPYDN
jgi:hypothetical protein